MKNLKYLKRKNAWNKKQISFILIDPGLLYYLKCFHAFKMYLLYINEMIDITEMIVDFLKNSRPFSWKFQ